MNLEKSQKEVQQALFSASALRSNETLPLKLVLDSVTNGSLAYDDLSELQGKGLIVWDLAMKAAPYMTPVSNPNHIIECVAYYGTAENGRSCIGFALGCISEDGTAIELNFIEKRNDAGNDFKSKFLFIIVDAFSLYGLYLNEAEMAKITRFVLIGPLEHIVPYYKDSGFIHQQNYNGTGVDAMYMELIKN